MERISIRFLPDHAARQLEWLLQLVLGGVLVRQVKRNRHRHCCAADSPGLGPRIRIDSCEKEEVSQERTARAVLVASGSRSPWK